VTQIPEAAVAVLCAGTGAGAILAPMYLTARRRIRAGDSANALAKTQLHAAGVQHSEVLQQWTLAAEETSHLVHRRLPALLQRLTHPHTTVPGPLHPVLSGTTLAQDFHQLEHLVTEAVTGAQHTAQSTTQAMIRDAVHTLQTRAYKAQEVLTDLQAKVDDPWLAERYLAMDELNEQQLQRLQVLASLAGTWPGLSRQDSHLPDILAAAKSRVQDAQRVQLISMLEQPVGVVGRAVEPVIIALAEFVANALSFSRGSVPVHVTLHQVAAGACIVVEDAGLGLHADMVAFATRMLDPHHRLTLSELGDPPRTGLAAIGNLAREYNFTASVQTGNRFGGAQATILIPEALLTVLDAAQQPMSPSAPLPPRSPAPDPGTGSFPQRRRRQPAAPAVPEPAAPPEPPQQSTGDRAQAWRSWQQGTTRGPDTTEGDRS